MKIKVLKNINTDDIVYLPFIEESANEEWIVIEIDIEDFLDPYKNDIKRLAFQN